MTQQLQWGEALSHSHVLFLSTPKPKMASIGGLSELVATLSELKAGLFHVTAAIEAVVSV